MFDYIVKFNIKKHEFRAFDKISFKSKGTMASLFKMFLWVMRKGSYSHDVITIGFPMKNWSNDMYDMLA